MSAEIGFSRRAIWVAIGFLGGATLCEGFPLLTIFDARPIPWLVNWGVGTGLAWVLAALVFALYVRHTLWSSELILRWRWRWHPLRLLAVPMALVTGMFEEAFFREFLMDYTARHYGGGGWGPLLQVLVSALVFGLVHAIWGLAGGSLVGAGFAMYYTSLLGGGLAIVYLAGGRGLWPCVAAHVAINLVCEPWMILSAASGAWTVRGKAR